MRLWSRVKSALFAALVFLVTMEIALVVAASLGALPVSLPSYSISMAKPFWSDINRDFGVWRDPGAVYRHVKSCFDVEYRANSSGMRDHEVAEASDQPRVVLLGDSFAEGYGVAYGARFSELLETEGGMEHLNFGTAGSFGSTQSMMLYETLASRFDHDAVIFAILPSNDFSDDRPSPEKLAAGARWRPYLLGDYPDYRVAYPEGEFEPSEPRAKHLEAIPREFSMTLRTGIFLEAFIKENWAVRQRARGATGSRYVDYDEAEFQRLRYAIERIKRRAGERPLLFFTIPRPWDFAAREQAGGPAPLNRALDALASEIGAHYLDLLEPMRAADWEGFFLPCDGHWSAEGHAFAAAEIARFAAERSVYP